MSASPMSIRQFAPAKINRFLHVLGRRADGYHNLQTLFQLLDAGDWLTIELIADEPTLILAHDLPFPPEDNLVMKAARLLQQEASCAQGARIHLEKNLPAGGGLGGGSSDAATALLSLNQLWNLDWSRQQLAALGLKLGADVPVFIHGHTAWGEGVGEQLGPVTLPEQTVLVLTPAIAISTALIFSHPDLPRQTPPLSLIAYLAGADTHNDCQALVRRLFPPVAEALAYLDQLQSQPGRLSGTGSSVFTIAPDLVTAQRWLQQAPCDGFVCSTINQSPAAAGYF